MVTVAMACHGCSTLPYSTLVYHALLNPLQARVGSGRLNSAPRSRTEEAFSDKCQGETSCLKRPENQLSLMVIFNLPFE